jgi:hypothetical protein
MKIEILKPTCIYGVPAHVGDVVDATDADANYLIQRGKAVLVTEAPAPVVIEPPIVEAPAKRKPRTKVTRHGDLPTDS